MSTPERTEAALKALEELKQTYRHCEACPELASHRSQVVFGDGDPPRCRLVIIGEAPGKKEDEEGIPFVGRSGQILDGYLSSIGLSREDVYITNTVLCRPPKNRNPRITELKACRPRLDQHLALLDPRVIITLGNFATRYFLETKEGITRLRGRIYEKGGYRVIPMQHPAVLLYNGMSPAKKAEFEEDFALVRQILEAE